MYIRIQNQTIRFRVSMEEANKLSEGFPLEDSLFLSDEYQLFYSITPVERDSFFSFDQENSHMALKINKDQLLEEIKDRPSKQGIKIQKLFTDESKSNVFLEIDIKKVKHS